MKHYIDIFENGDKEDILGGTSRLGDKEIEEKIRMYELKEVTLWRSEYNNASRTYKCLLSS